MTEAEALTLAIREAGGHRKLAAILGIYRTAIYQWEVAPAKRVMAIEAATGGKVSRHDLRPDIFGPPPSKQRRKAA